jgi:type VI secretion system protein ImpJ
MTEGNKVVWSEGLFLRTQHFQQQDRHAEALVRGALRGQPLPAFGFRSLALDPAALSSGAIGLTAAEGLFPDGTPFRLAETTLPVDAVPVARETPPGLVQLALPAVTAGAATIDPHHGTPSGARYRGEFVRVRDTIRAAPRPRRSRSLASRPGFWLPGQETGGYVTLPVARIQGLDAAGAVALVEGFLPPALVTAAVPWYAQFAQEVVNGLDRIAEAMAGWCSAAPAPRSRTC